MGQHALALIITAAMFIAAPLLFQYMGGRGILFASPRAMRYAFVVMRGAPTDEEDNGGDIVGFIHGIPGMRAVWGNPTDIRSLHMEPGDEPEKTWLRQYLGIEWLGPEKTLRLNTVRSIRFARDNGEAEYSLKPKDKHTRWVHYMGQQDFEVKGVETKGGLGGVDLKFNLKREDKYPGRVILDQADATALLTIIGREKSIGIVGLYEPEQIIGGDESEKIKKNLAAQVLGVSNKILEETGMIITAANLFDVVLDEKTKQAVEARARAEREAKAKLETAKIGIEIAKAEAEAEVRRADGRKRSKILDNDAQADHIDRVVVPGSADELRVRYREAEAYENNDHVTTSVKIG